MRPKARWSTRRGVRVLWTEGPVRTPRQIAWAGNASRDALRGEEGRVRATEQSKEGLSAVTITADFP